ncbi:MAG: hypothetical protein JWN70_5732, partial [Planctomycetaceae bacterium]|nr:hypothetical protein [Planctomycetaceae bacterium]
MTKDNGPLTKDYGQLPLTRKVLKMETKYESSPAAIAELALGGVVLERREMMVCYALECLRLGITELEIRPALVDYVKAKKWPWQELDARMGIVEVALKRYRKERPDLFAPAADESGELQVVSLGDVAPEEVRWLWPETIPVGKVTVVYGEPGIGKTCWALDLAARVSAGINWPAPRWRRVLPPLPPPVAGKVLLLNGEDHVGNSIRPRLCRGQANLPNVVAIKVPKSTAPGGPRAFDLGRDTPMLKQQIEALGDVRLVIIDPLEAYTGAGPRSQKMRALLGSLEALAEECGIAVVVISACQKCELPVKYVWRVDGEITNLDLRWMVPVRC